MFLVDFNQIAISNMMVAVNTYAKNMEINEDLLRHMILNSIRAYKVKFGEKYGEPIICCDGRNYWRKDVFPYYKASRKKTRAASTLDWRVIFETLNTIRDELKEYFPYGVIDINGAEADDIIGVLMAAKAPFEPGLILSGDKDFRQLQRYMNVDQYAPVQKKFLRELNPERYLKEHIIRGDAGDGIPNFLSSDDVFMHEGKRQKSIQTKRLDGWMEHEPEDFCNEDMLRNYKRNEQLIDLTKIPVDLKNKILSEYEIELDVMGDRSRLLTYFISRKLKNLMGDIQDF